MWIRGVDITKTEDNGKQDYSITITPYLDMYPLIKFGSSGSWAHGEDAAGKPIRLKAGNSYTFKDSANFRDFIYIGAPGWIRIVGDLSKCYMQEGKFATGQRLQSLTIGSSLNGYKNSNLKDIDVKSNTLLEYLDLSNVTGLVGELDLTNNINLKTIKATGTNISSISFAPGGKVSQVELPLSVTKIDLKDLKYLSANSAPSDPNDSYFSIPDRNNVESLTIENCPGFTISNILNKFNCVDASGKRVLKNIRLTKMSFGNYTYDNFISDFDGLRGLDINGNTTPKAWLDGTIHFTGSLTGAQYNKVSSEYPWLAITYNSLESTLSFMDTDGESKFADDQTIIDNPNISNDNNGTNPATEESKPYKASDDEFKYEFIGWSVQKDTIIGENKSYDKDAINNKALNNIIGDRVLYPVFKEIRQEYTVTLINPNSNGNDVVLLEVKVPYGNTIPKLDTDPKKLDSTADADLYTFIGWAKGDGTIPDSVTSDLELYAQFAILDKTWHEASITEFNTGDYSKPGYLLDNANKNINLIRYRGAGNSAVKIPDRFTVAGELYTVTGVGGFLNHIELELINLPDTTKEITYSNYSTQGAFEGCANLAEITLPPAVEKIGEKAFFGCTKLSEIAIPENVNSIGNAAFAGCTGLKTITVDANNNAYYSEDYGLIERSTGKLIQALPGIHTLPNSTLPKTVTTLGSYCFYKLPITTIKLPSGITTIPNNAFAGCSLLTSVTLPNTIEILDPTCFSGCSALSSITLPTGLTSIKTFVFNECGLTDVEIPPTVTELLTNSFGNIKKLKTVTFARDANGSYQIPSIDATAFENSGPSSGLTFNVPWSETEHEGKFGSKDMTWGATEATLNFNYGGKTNV
jgi:hypothetical protein